MKSVYPLAIVFTMLAVPTCSKKSSGEPSLEDRAELARDIPENIRKRIVEKKQENEGIPGFADKPEKRSSSGRGSDNSVFRTTMDFSISPPQEKLPAPVVLDISLLSSPEISIKRIKSTVVSDDRKNPFSRFFTKSVFLDYISDCLIRAGGWKPKENLDMTVTTKFFIYPEGYVKHCTQKTTGTNRLIGKCMCEKFSTQLFSLHSEGITKVFQQWSIKGKWPEKITPVTSILSIP
ncbi:MAG: hypothetical protein JXR95_16000 [Deltaproteobacteria bacterium]|nr:hypothetical protein [Deltaproteobacteria bacterium]